MTQLMRFPTAIARDAAIETWMRRHGALGEIAARWFAVMRDCGRDVRELLHDGHPTACVGDAAFAYVNAFTAHVNVGFFRGAELAFKKIDSLLRGRSVDEIAACLRAGLFESALIAPAFPAQQRITRGGRQYWRVGSSDDWQPVERDLLGELRRRGLPIRHARFGPEVVGRAFFLCDAATEADLQSIVDAGRRLAAPPLWIVSAPLPKLPT